MDTALWSYIPGSHVMDFMARAGSEALPSRVFLLGISYAQFADGIKLAIYGSAAYGLTCLLHDPAVQQGLEKLFSLI